jgi:transposase
MFIRKTRKIDRKLQKKYFSFQLVESMRTPAGPRQRILLNLGSELLVSDNERKLLANRIEEIIAGTESFIDIPENIEELAIQFATRIKNDGYRTSRSQAVQEDSQDDKDFQEVDVNAIDIERVRQVGVEHVSLGTIQRLGLDKCLTRIGLSKRQISLVVGAITGRLAGCCSERGTLAWLRNTSGLGELIDTDFAQVSDKGIYQVSDKLLKHRASIERHLENQETELFSLDNTVVLYDLTNTYFEGKMEGASLAAKGHSKEKRSDCPLVTLGLVLNSQGFPLRSNVFGGSVSEGKTLEGMINDLTPICSSENPIVVMDAGIATEVNLAWLREKKYRYIVCSRQRISSPPDDLQFEIVSEKKGGQVRASCLPDSETGELHLYCLSDSRREGELAWLKEARANYEKELLKLKTGLMKKACIKGVETVTARLSKLKARYTRLSTFYQINVELNDTKKRVIGLSWTFDEKAAEERFQGAYRLRTYGLEWDAQRLWQTYIMLTEVEEAFRYLKSDLGMRPVYHRLDHRIEGHLFLSILAYHVLRSIIYQLERAGILLSWPTIRDRLVTQTRVSLRIPTRNNGTLYIRKTTSPELFHKKVYTALNLTNSPGRVSKTYL